MKKGYCKCGCGNLTPIAYRNRFELGHKKGEPIDYLKGHKMRGLTGKKHWNYKGNKAGYKAFHLRISLVRGKPFICSECGSDYYVEWANLSGKYEDVFDYKPLCRKCHNRFDNVANKGWATRRLGVVSR